ncbi:mitochondrial 40S ribosomal protein MRP2 [Verticillium alfalfae VaMs.102]|uniref:Mitochondrial 40S ribosomal protein MRP2 n=1 Tax=Verticillium alfalfae (strain VaMs.102 / ATCC MYA-4576 / FGSC 10136) TaxID=526221 RepID=C9SBI3_VERA1|nr:mitochondrial 40S ribosomal protein MRP2 [Verticillium alfalfae VaMs.102]EEY15717.1 mitochondrial 40S ribosomal protein MRP2 [Verticillium alfalfae VaMs.102]
MSMFRPKKLDLSCFTLSCFTNVRVLRDNAKRQVFQEHETQRQALRYLIRNTTLPPRVRAEAQLQLTQMHAYTRPTQIRNRCIMGGKSRGVFRDFKMSRTILFGSTRYWSSQKSVLGGAVFDYGAQRLFGRTYFLLGFPSVSDIDLHNVPPQVVWSPQRLSLSFQSQGPWVSQTLVGATLSNRHRYFINEDDEIRSVTDPDRYFKYWIDKNMRVNGRQRFHFNGPSAARSHSVSPADRSLDAVQKIVHARLEAEGLEQHSLPFGSKPADPQVTIFASADLYRKSRVTVIFGEPNQSLGILALRVANGPGGISMGTMVSVVQTLKQQVSSPDDSQSPGIILCNVGAVFWCLRRARLTLGHMSDMPLASLAHHGRRITTANQVPGLETSEKHISYIFEAVLPALTSEDARLDLLGIGLSADMLEAYLDQDYVWSRWGSRINTLSILGGITDSASLKHQDFRDFLAKRARAYITSEEPADMPLAGPHGNSKTSAFLNHGTAAVYSSGEPYYVEMILVRARESILGWLGEVAAAGFAAYQHPEITVVDIASQMEASTESAWANVDTEWGDVPVDVKPTISFGGDGHDVTAAAELVISRESD